MQRQLPQVEQRRGPARLASGAAALALPFLVISPPGLSSASEVAESAQGIEQIVVVAHKNSRSIRDVAASVTTLSREDLQTELAMSLDDAFRYVPGVDSEVAGTRFGTENVNIRGIGGNRVAILVDGVPVSDQFDIGSFSNATRDFIDTGLVRDIEILHGPASALYGSSAIGGVVAVRTPDPYDVDAPRGLTGDISLAWRGADDSQHQRATLSLANPSFGVLIGGSLRRGNETQSAALDNTVDKREYDRRTGLAKVVVDDRRGNTWRATMIHQQSSVQSDLDALLGTGRYRSTTALAGDDSYRTDLANLSYDFAASRGLFDEGVLRAFISATDISQNTLDERANAPTPVSINRHFVFQQDSRGIDLNLWKDFTGRRVSHRLGYGLEFRDRRTEELRNGQETNIASGETTDTILGEVFPLRDFPVSSTTETGAYLEDTVAAGRWRIIGAVRLDKFGLRPRSDDIFAADNPSSTPVALDESDISPKLGVVYRLSSYADMYAQYAHGFRAPPYSDANIGLDIPMFNVRAIPNPDLRSELSEGFEAGLRMLRPNLDLHLDLFHTNYVDFIETKVRIGVDPESGRLLFQSRNIDKATIKGAEAALSWRFGGERRALGLDVSAYYATGRNRNNGQPLNSVGPPQAVVGLKWDSASARQQLRLKTVLTGRWNNPDDSGSELFESPGHAVVDLYHVLRISDHATVRTGLHNLADRTYWHWTAVRGLAPDNPLVPVLARPGRSISINVDLIW